MLITIEDDLLTLSTRLYEKKENLYLYLPTNSSHSPGNLKGLIFGMVFRTLHLTSSEKVQRLKIRKLYNRLVARGYQPALLNTIIEQAHAKISKEQVQPKALPPSDLQREHLFFHTYYHPDNDTSVMKCSTD